MKNLFAQSVDALSYARAVVKAASDANFITVAQSLPSDEAALFVAETSIAKKTTLLAVLAFSPNRDRWQHEGYDIGTDARTAVERIGIRALAQDIRAAMRKDQLRPNALRTQCRCPVQTLRERESTP